MHDLFIYLDALFLHMHRNRITQLPMIADPNLQWVITDVNHYRGLEIHNGTTGAVMGRIASLSENPNGCLDIDPIMTPTGIYDDLLSLIHRDRMSVSLPADWVGLYAIIHELSDLTYCIKSDELGDINVLVDPELNTVLVHPSNSPVSPHMPVPVFKAHNYIQHMVVTFLKAVAERYPKG